MENDFDAKQAKRLADENSPDGLFNIVISEIKQEAARGGYSYVTRNYGFGESELYDVESNYPRKILETLKKLRSLGFYATVRTEERQFVDIFLEVKW
jgi:hypothetical protein